jgi:uncharacterized protein YdeI (YjbR/CyaY-like superfamily)
MDPLVTKVHSQELRWSAEFTALRTICLACELHESLKWGQACYDLQGRNIVLIHGFKDYCALLFMQGALLQDPDEILVQQTRHVQAARQIRFKSLADIEKHRTSIEAYIRQAIQLEQSGAKVAIKDLSQYEVPEEFQSRLDKDPALAAAFRALTPGRQKAYLLYFSEAKKSSTREARITKHAPRILGGLGLNDE